MSSANQHLITDLKVSPGELSFQTRVGGLDKRLFIRTDAELTPTADAALVACLMPAMTDGGTLTMSDPISPRLLRTQREFQGIQRAWSRAWPDRYPRLQEIEVRAPTRDPQQRQLTGRVAAFFSGGVDSWATVLDNPDLTDLIFVRGIDLLPAADHQAGLADEVEARLREAAAALGLPLHVVETNLRELADPLVPWEAYYGCAVVAAALLLAPCFDRVMIAGDSDYEVQVAVGANRLVDQLFSTEDLELVDSGGRFSRMQRVRRIGGHPVVQQTLRVCWENPGGAYNCGRCRKCLMTMTALEAAGLRGGVITFPAELDLGLLDLMRIEQPVSLQLWEDVLDAAADSGNLELEQALGRAVTKARVELGFAPDQRRRLVRPAAPAAPAAQEIANLRASPGELSFEARIGGESKRVWFRARTEAEFVPPADAALAACLMPAMRLGGTLEMSDPVSPRMLRNQREFAAIQQAWSPRWTFDQEPLRELEVKAPVRAVEQRPPGGRVAAFFNGDLDSWSTVLDNPDLTDLIFVVGARSPADGPEPGDEAEAQLHDAAAALGLRLHTVATNLRELSDPLIHWKAYGASALAAVALLFEQLFDRVLITGKTDYEPEPQIGTAWTIDSLWSTERLEIVDAGGRLDYIERARTVATNEVARESLRGGLRTEAALEAIGARESFANFAGDLDLGQVREAEIEDTGTLVTWEDILRAARAEKRRDLTAAIEACIDRGRERLSLGPLERFRHRPTAALRGIPGQHAPPALFASPATAAALASSRSIALLVGSYDGSGNFGDIAQLDAALRLLAPFEPGLLVLPVIERACGPDHRLALKQMQNPPEHVLHFGPGAEDDGLVAAAPRPGLAYAACYLYGGGYLNPDWGDRKLAMLGAAETLALAGGNSQVDRISSGLQVDLDWLAGLSAADQRTLRAFALLGGRDAESTAALAALGSAATVFDSGDDAIGLLPARRSAPEQEGSHLLVNVHFAEHGWVTDDPGAILRFYTSFLTELGRLAGRPLLVQPLLTYVDSRTDERPGLDRLTSTCREQGVESLESLLLRPADLDSVAAQLGRAELTLSCSFHASLASLMLGVPTILVEDRPYYEQKAAGLRRDFELPDDLTASSEEDPGTVAKRALAAIDGESGAALRQRLAFAGASAAARRSRTEAAIASRLGAGAITALGVDGTGPALRRELEAESERTADAKREADEAHRLLGTLAGSRSWRLTSPLRKVGAAVRGRIRAARNSPKAEPDRR